MSIIAGALTTVAPHAGAWIETSYQPPDRRCGLSRPTRARGLKRGCPTGHIQQATVAPHAGAWIETSD